MVAAVIAPLGFAFSVDSDRSLTPASASPTLVAASASMAVPAFVPASSRSASASMSTRHLTSDVPDAAQLFFAGTLLFGLAAAVRKAF